MTDVVKRIVDGFGGEHLSFRCPGCGDVHVVSVRASQQKPQPVWGWNDSLERPSFTPSLLVQSGHHVPGHGSKGCWCTYNAEHPERRAVFTCYVCHSFVIDGRIQFLGDCTHSLAGQTVELPPFEDTA